MKLVWLPRAVADRDAQIEHIAQDRPLAAIGQGDELERQVRQLVEQPELGREGRVAGTRELVVSRTRWVVVYRVRRHRVELLRVLHDARQWPAQRR